tara:strand:+ start:5238 stop:5585 length:348 start_codon:yes stop_codon:yes gene_type:complete
MEQFMLIVREDLARIGRLTDEERFSSSPDMGEWVNSLMDRGLYITGTPLGIEGRYVSQDQVLFDGPFITASEGISGFDLIWAEDLEQATEIAQNCPMVKIGHCIREVRQVVALPE